MGDLNEHVNELAQYTVAVGWAVSPLVGKESNDKIRISLYKLESSGLHDSADGYQDKFLVVRVVLE